MEPLIARIKAWGKVPHYLTGAAALLAGLVVWGEVRHWRTPEIDSPRYLVARRPLSKGEWIQWSDFRLESARAGETPVQGAATDQDLIWLKGAKLNRALARGERLDLGGVELTREAASLGQRIPLGSRAYVIPNETHLPLRVGDRVDLQIVSDEQGRLVLVEGAVILQNSIDEASDAVVALGPDEIALVEKGRRSGKLILSLRHPEEQLPKKKRRVGKRGQPAPRHRIEIWTEDS